MNIVGGIWLITTVLCFSLFISTYLTAEEKFRKRHPTARMEKSLFGEKIYGYLMAFVLTTTPIVNFLTLFTLANQYDDIVESTISKIEEKIISEE